MILKFILTLIQSTIDFTQNLKVQLEFQNDKNATSTIDDRLIESFNRPEGPKVHHQNQNFFYEQKFLPTLLDLPESLSLLGIHFKQT